MTSWHLMSEVSKNDAGQREAAPQAAYASTHKQMHLPPVHPIHHEPRSIAVVYAVGVDVIVVGAAAAAARCWRSLLFSCVCASKAERASSAKPVTNIVLTVTWPKDQPSSNGEQE